MNFTKVLAAVAISATVAFSSCKPKDADIQKSIEEKIAATASMAGTKVEVKDGVATISGQCKDADCKANCEKMIGEIKGVKSVVNNCTLPAPIVVANADPLMKGVTDALKDLATVKSDVKDGVITLTGEITKDKLMKLMPILQSLKPKKIENKLTVK
jgi:hypothetical protein